ncbi:glycosyltransferase family 2 protein [Zobellella aerophila]|uniref:N-acetylglucosaminyl-diphospho-decaprenol L-rhamnosyltransferase WbbL n=1 Tax=Zobellella aerophila TaxID=870480 RepID=A0ABP6VML4_9GAMM
MRKVFISVVSHCHGEVIQKVNCLPALARYFTVVVKSNVKEALENYCFEHDILYLPPTQVMGFGENNNVIFQYCKQQLGMKGEDFFILINPDVYVSFSAISTLISEMESADVSCATINLFRDYEMTIHDYSVRNFPGLFDFISSYIGLKNKTKIVKEEIFSPCLVDWAAGSFLAFESDKYELVGGFDEKYFMYCEDINIFFRLKKQGYPLVFFPDIKAVHLAQHKNRKLFSMHFFWHAKSVIRYLIDKITYDLKKHF